MPAPLLPPGFRWGTYAAAFASEGARMERGRGESTWDRFLTRRGAIEDGDADARGSDSYARGAEDVALARGLGLGVFGFSISWTRILPEGVGRADARGLDHYDRLVELVLEAGLEPLPCCFHWDLPQALEERGGLASPDAPAWLAALAEHVVRRLGDRLGTLLTVAEPQVMAFRGHADGSHAPGVRDWRVAARALDGLLRGHAAMAAAIRGSGRPIRVGALVDRRVVEPASDRGGDADAAVRVDGWANRLVLDALLGRGYPDDVVALLGEELLDPFLVAAMAETPRDLDVLAVRAHRPEVVCAASTGPLHATLATPPPTHVDGAALRDVLVATAAAAPEVPLLVVGSDQAFDDHVAADGRVHDAERAALLVERIESVAAALAAGAPVEGHLVWTLLDGFGWARGAGARHGIVRHDPWTGDRVVKDSGRAYAALARGEEP